MPMDAMYGLSAASSGVRPAGQGGEERGIEGGLIRQPEDGRDGGAEEEPVLLGEVRGRGGCLQPA